MRITTFVRRAIVSTALVFPVLGMAMPNAEMQAAAAVPRCSASLAINPFGIFGSESGEILSARDANYYNCRCCTAFGWPDCCAKCH